MGRASASAKWLAQDPSSSSSYSQMTDEQVELLRSMQSMMNQNRPEAASTAFFEWSLKAERDASQPTHIATREVKLFLDIS